MVKTVLATAVMPPLTGNNNNNNHNVLRSRKRNNKQQQQQREYYEKEQQEQNNNINENKNIIQFPSFNDTYEMATLSSLIYAFHKDDYGNNDTSNTNHVCGRINNNNSNNNTIINNRIIPNHITCHYYHHDWIGGTQVMIISSITKNYLSIIFAGTDDLRTSLTDANILMTKYGTSTTSNNDNNNNTKNSNDNDNNDKYYYNVSFNIEPTPKVHAGFDHAIFDRNLFGKIIDVILPILKENNSLRLFTTGHSLGAADSILTAIGLIQYSKKYDTNNDNIIPYNITSINFGCPKTGNTVWKDTLHNNPYYMSRLHIWRFVLGWDVIPRLPEFFDHVGHTVQLQKIKNNNENYTIVIDNTTAPLVYYQHYGNTTLQYASVPFGWSAKPFIWVPGALWTHSMTRYYNYFTTMKKLLLDDIIYKQYWIHDFVRIPDYDDSNSTNNNDDDDYYVDPPDDDYYEYYYKKEQ